MRFEEAYGGWQQGRLTQEDAARLLGVCERTFQRHIDRYEDAGLKGLIDKRLNQLSHRRAPVDEVVRLVDCYRKRHDGWSAKHFYAWYKRDGSTHEWVPGQHWDLIVTMDDATNEHYSIFFVDEEGTQSSFYGVREVIEAHGLFSSFYSDRGSHYWTTPEAGGKESYTVRTRYEVLGYTHDCCVFSRSAGTFRAGFCDSSGAAT